MAAKAAPRTDDGEFFDAVSRELSWKVSAATVKVLRGTLGQRDATAEPVRAEDGQPVPDSELRDFENVPLRDNIDDYFRREVLPQCRTPGWTAQRTRRARDRASPSTSMNTLRCDPRQKSAPNCSPSMLKRRPAAGNRALAMKDNIHEKIAVEWIGTLPVQWQAKPMFRSSKR